MAWWDILSPKEPYDPMVKELVRQLHRISEQDHLSGRDRNWLAAAASYLELAGGR